MAGTKTAQRHQLVSIAGIPGYFQRMAGGHVGGDTSESFDGGSDIADLIPGPVSAEDVTISRDFDPFRDQPILRQLRPLVMRWRTTVTRQPTDYDYVPVGEPDVYAGALLKRVREVEVDSGSNTATRFELVFAVNPPH
jgi:hypothetical protein